MDFGVEIGTQIGLAVGAAGLLFRDTLTAFGRKIVRKIDGKKVVLTNHPIFDKLSQHLQLLEYKTYTNDPYKQMVLHDREIIFWHCISTTLHGMSISDYSKMDDSIFEKHIEECIEKLNSYVSELYTAGIPKKTIECMEGSIIKTRVFVIALLNTITKDTILQNKESKIWQFFTIYNEYLQYAHSNVIDVLIEANGSLYGEVYKNIENIKK